MYYEINVARKVGTEFINGKEQARYRHLFATHERSITGLVDLKIVLDLFKEKFPEPEFKINVTKYETTGYIINTDSLEIED